VRGLLADANVEGDVQRLRWILERLGLWAVMAETGCAFQGLAELNIARNINDRSLWQYCQQEGWVLFTDNRNNAGGNSLQATIGDSWRPGCLPVLTIANRKKLASDGEYAQQVAITVAEILFGIPEGDYRDEPRIFVPR
jgi:hypothetical protein